MYENREIHGLYLNIYEIGNVVQKKQKIMFSVQNKLEIDKLPVASRMLKLEVPELALEVISTVEKYNPEELLIEPMFQILIKQMPIIKMLDVPYGKDPVRLSLRPLKQKLMLHASEVRLHLQLLKKTEDEKNLFEIQAAVDRHLRYLSKSKNRKIVNQKITQFIHEVKSNQALKEVMIEFDFMPIVERLELALTDVRALIAKRTQSDSEKPKKTAREMMEIVLSSLNDLFKEIELSQLRNPEIDYAPLIHELNSVTANFKQVVNLREAANRRKAAEMNGGEQNDDAIEEGDDTDGQPGDVENVDGSAYESNGSGDLNESSDLENNLNASADSDLNNSAKKEQVAAGFGDHEQQLDSNESSDTSML